MSNLLRRSWFGRFQHLSEESLLAYLDGELGPARQRQITAHLQNCWACRNRRDKIERAIDVVMDCFGVADAQDAPDPRARHVFETRLHSVAAQPPGIGFWRWLVLSAGPLKYACVSAALVFAVIWAYLGSTPSVSAMEFLNRAEAAESRRIQTVGMGVAYQKLRLRVTTARTSVERVATLEIRGSTGHPEFPAASSDDVWQDVERILRLNGIERPLSAAAFERWRNSIPRSHESVRPSKLDDGSNAFTLATESALPHTPDTILESTLVVRAGDWRPVEQNLTVQAVDDVLRYNLTEVAFDVRPADVVAARDTGTRRNPPAFPVPPALEPAGVIVPPLPAFMVDLEGVEIQARYALHHLGACLGEPIQVTRDASGSIAVRGLAETPDRKQELLAAFEGTPWTTVEIRTVEEAMEGRGAQAASTGVVGTDTGGLPLPIQAQLEAYFKKRVDPGLVSDEISALANQASSLAQSVLVEAGALRNLAKEYPSPRAAALRPAFQRLLLEMFEDHAAALREKAAQCRTTIEPVLSALFPHADSSFDAAGSDSGDRLAALFEAARDSEQLTLTLFTGSNRPCAQPEREAARLLTALRDIEMHSTVAVQDFNRGLFASAAKDPGIKRR